MLSNHEALILMLEEEEAIQLEMQIGRIIALLAKSSPEQLSGVIKLQSKLRAYTRRNENA